MDIYEWLGGANRSNDVGIDFLKKCGLASLAEELDKSRLPDKGRRIFFAVKKALDERSEKSIEKNIPQKKEKYIPSKTYHQPALKENEASINLKKQADLLYKEMSNKRALLFNLCTLQPMQNENAHTKIGERAKLATEIMELQYKMDDAYETYRYALINGEAPPQEKDVNDVDPIFLHKKISNLRKLMSKYRNSGKESDKGKLPQKEAELESLIKRYEKETARY